MMKNPCERESHIKLTHCSAYVQSHPGLGQVWKRDRLSSAFAITEMRNQEKLVVVMAVQVYSSAGEFSCQTFM